MSHDVETVESRRMIVTGADGQLAQAIRSAFRDREIVALTRSMLDVTDHAAVARVVSDARPWLIVNCTAFNDVDGAEDRPLDALAVNAFALRSLARAAEAVGAVLVHYGTDFVIHTESEQPHEESVRPARAAAASSTPRSAASDTGRSFHVGHRAIHGSAWRFAPTARLVTTRRQGRPCSGRSGTRHSTSSAVAA